ncbi:MAG: transglycosylase SLT domain-containing protein [Bdellovibrionales bacterium]
MTLYVRITLLFCFLVGFAGSIQRAHAADKGPNYEVFQSLMKAAQYDEAFRVLSTDIEKESNLNLKSLAYFGLGYISQLQKKDEKAIEYFDLALVPSKEFEDLIRIYKGRSLKTLGKSAEAKAEFQKAQSLEPKIGRAVIESHMALAELELSEKKWTPAFNLLAKLERRTRGDIRYPEVLMGLVRTELFRNKRFNACKWARKLYSRFSHHSLTQSWGIDLHKVTVDSKPLECVASLSDQRARIKNLQQQGLSERALKEIEEVKTRSTALTKVHVDTLLANYYLTEGKVTEAFNVLLPYYKKEGRDFAFFMLLGRVAARAGEFQVAVGSFQRAHALNRKSKAGRSALFQAAFLSYQFQDYDGASRRYEEFMKKYPRSGLSQDAKWHLSWIRYLKGDYVGAYEGFKSSAGAKKKRKPTLMAEKNMYWMAMSLYKMNRNSEAIAQFERIAADKSLGFYSLSAKARLHQLKAIDIRQLAKQADESKDEKSSPIGDAAQLAALSETAQSLAENEENESEDDEKTLATFESGEDEADGDEGAEAVAQEPASLAKAFKSANMAKRFQRANDLILLGFTDWATWELFELERRTSQPNHLKTLVSRYESIGAFHRSSYISQIFFSRQRYSFGFTGEGRLFWQAAYPRAYERSVTTFARTFNVPEEFAWAIMRAESQFKSDVKSPVGALGLMQLMPYTAMQVARILDFKGFTVPQLFDSGTNVRLGVRYLQRLQKQFEGNIALSAAGYNAGPHKVRGWIKSFGSGLDVDEFVEHIPYLETRNYVKKVVQNYHIYRQLYNKSAKSDELLSWLAKPVGITITGEVESRENWD